MSFKWLGLFPLMLVSLAGCRLEDKRDFTLHLEPSEKIERKAIDDVLKDLCGITYDTLEIDREKGTVKLEYDSMLIAKENIRQAFEYSGFIVKRDKEKSGQ